MGFLFSIDSNEVETEKLENFDWQYNENDGYVYDEQGNNVRWYNCGGFALNTRDWYLPYDQSEWNGTWEIGGEMGQEPALGYMVDFMLEEFAPNLRVIHSEEELESFERLILFRVSHCDDFHFVRKDADGKYYHKMGSDPYPEEMEREEVYGESWCRRYDGPIVMFAYKDRYPLRRVG